MRLEKKIEYERPKKAHAVLDSPARRAGKPGKCILDLQLPKLLATGVQPVSGQEGLELVASATHVVNDGRRGASFNQEAVCPLMHQLCSIST